MVKEKRFSAYYDFRTGFFYKLSILLGIILIIIYASLKIISTFINQESTGWVKALYDFSQSSKSESIIAFAIILLALGVILYFFHYQFGKLAEIAEEVENSEEYEENE
jgi:amino acid transporter